MKLLRIKVDGLSLFKEQLDLCFYAQQRVGQDDLDNLYPLFSNFYLNPVISFIGINASGKTTTLKVISFVLDYLGNKPVNNIKNRGIFDFSERIVFDIYFYDEDHKVYRLNTSIDREFDEANRIKYSIASESLWAKDISTIKTKNALTDFTGLEPVEVRNSDEHYLPDDVSIMIAFNKRNRQRMTNIDLMMYTDYNDMPLFKSVPLELIKFLDPTIEYIKTNNYEDKDKRTICLKFKDRKEIQFSDEYALKNYLSSGTIKGITTFTVAWLVLNNGGFLIVDEIENHFNKEIVSTLIRFFMDNTMNKKGAVLFFSTHYSELLDEFDRNDSIFITRNRDGITAENLSNILKRNDIKKSDAYESGYLEGTTPIYEAYIDLKKRMQESFE